MTTIRRLLVALALSIGLAVVITPSAASAAAVLVRPGETVEIDPGGVSPLPDQLSVTPPEAGAASPRPFGGIRFTAASDYLGAATITYTQGGNTSVYDIVVVGPSGGVDATFTPRAAPGPCLVIVSGATVAFGDVTLGSPATAATQTDVRSCTSITTTLRAAVAPATSGVSPNVTTLTPTDRLPIPADSFRYELNGGFPSILSTGALLIEDPFNPLQTETFTHTLTVGAGSSGIGQQFSTTVTFTATTA